MESAVNSTPIVFRNTTFDVVDRSGQPWLRLPQIEGALGYTNKGKGLYNIYKAHADEFTDSMTAVIKLPTAGGEQDVRIFSPRGCYALGMFARTKVAKDFRVWVLDVLEGKAAVPTPPMSDKTNRVPLKDAVNMLVAKQPNLSYSDAYRLVHQRFGVESVEQLTIEQVRQAVEYVHNLLVGRGGEPLNLMAKSDAQIHNLMGLCSIMLLGAERWPALYKALTEIGSPFAAQFYDIFGDGASFARHAIRNFAQEFAAVQGREPVEVRRPNTPGDRYLREYLEKMAFAHEPPKLAH